MFKPKTGMGLPKKGFFYYLSSFLNVEVSGHAILYVHASMELAYGMDARGSEFQVLFIKL